MRAKLGGNKYTFYLEKDGELFEQASVEIMGAESEKVIKAIIEKFPQWKWKADYFPDYH